MPSYDPDAVYDDVGTAHYLQLIYLRCDDLAAEARNALRFTGSPRQMHFDRLMREALTRDVWSPDERLTAPILMGQGVLDNRPEQRTVPVQVKLTLTEREQLRQEADAMGLTISELVRQRVLV